MIDARHAFPLLCSALTGQEALALVERLPLSSLAHDGAVRLSLGTVRHADEGGVAALVRLQFACVQEGLRLELVDVTPPVRSLLDRIGLGALFSVAPQAAPLLTFEPTVAR